MGNRLGFVEFVDDDSGYPRLVAVSQIAGVTRMVTTDRALVSLVGGGAIAVRESYSRACALIAAASPESR